MSKKSFSRENEEKSEGKETITNELPETRVQKTQQVSNSADALKTAPVSNSFQPKTTEGKGAELKQEKISDVLTGSSSSTGMGINAGGRGVSGTAGGVLGANNSTPIAEKSRSASRFGKKLDRLATKLNYTPCEQVLIAVDESKPLADAASADQGYNGTYRNTYARSQKIAGAVPANLMFERSVDLILKDKLYFVEGQMCFQDGDNGASYNPSRRAVRGSDALQPVVYHTGNYVHRGLHVGLKPDGSISHFYFDVDDVTPAALSPDDANMVSAHRLIKSNVAELDRMTMDAKAGDEKADLWSPLPRAIAEPTKASFLMSSIEADTGAYVALAYSKASTNFSYQLNRAAKDGMEILVPAIEQCVGWRTGALDESYYKTSYPTLRSLFNADSYAAGDPTLMIAAYDSTGKYNNKADLLLQPRGWRMHLQTADNNMNALRIPGEFVNVFAATETFSTIDREYDPLLPICMTDKANLITSHNLNEFGSFYNDYLAEEYESKATIDWIKNGDEYYHHVRRVLLKWKAIDAMDVDDDVNFYVYGKVSSTGDSTTLEAIEGLETDIRLKAELIAGTPTFTVNMVVSTSDVAPEGYTLIEAYSAALIKAGGNDICFWEPVNDTGESPNVTGASHSISMGGKLEYRYGGTYAYAYSDLRNDYTVYVQHPLLYGIRQYIEEAMGAKFYSLLEGRELYIPFVFSTQYMTLAQIIICAATPWIQRVRQNSFKDVIYYEENTGSYPYSKLIPVKDAPTRAFANFGFSGYDSPLETRVMNPVQAINWVLPEFFWKLSDDTYVLPWYFNELDLTVEDGQVVVDDDAANMSMPSIRSGIRLAALDSVYGMSEKDLRLSLDRIAKPFLRASYFTDFRAYKYGRTTDGQIMVHVDFPNHFINIHDFVSAPRELGLSMDAPGWYLTPSSTNDIATSGQQLITSFRIKIWQNPRASRNPTILAADDVNIDRAANYTQYWRELNCEELSDTSLNGLVFGLGDDTPSYVPFADIVTGNPYASGVTVTSYQRALYTRLQFLPFVISPFDAVSTDDPYDIYDFAYMFGLAGFRGSDYRESVYNREKEVVNQGMLFIQDPWIMDSAIIRGSASNTGVKETKGYEVK